MDPENIEDRVTALESQVNDLNRRVRANEQDAQAARVLAGAADRDVADLGSELRDVRGDLRDFRGEVRDFRGEFDTFRGHVQDFRGEFDTFREEVRDFRDEFRGTRDEFHAFRRATVSSFNALREDMNDRFAQVDNGFIGIRGKIDAVAAGQQQIVYLIQGLMNEPDEDDSAEPPRA